MSIISTLLLFAKTRFQAPFRILTINSLPSHQLPTKQLLFFFYNSRKAVAPGLEKVYNPNTFRSPQCYFMVQWFKTKF